ncbi:MAG: hypothetical protein HQK73_05020 [Desulfamplus sp.]|nr:hypothetical protein [Desulfamplus sp.]MBF0411561.1 hypothetical protein [Desulfamplus sp.]
MGKFIIILSVLLVCISCGDNSTTSLSGKTDNYPVTYSFFDVGVNSFLSHSLKSRLDSVLGDHAVETRNTINLNINNEGFLKNYFPSFDELNQRLNSPTGRIIPPPADVERKTSLIAERVEHNTVKLGYRYAVKKNLPFNYVEFLFSDFNNTPLMIRVKFKKDDLNVVDTLHQKYGTPREILWKEENGKSLCWENSGDLLILSFVPDQFGKPVYEVAIYFAKRLEDLLEAERLERERKHKKGVKSGQNVF